MDNLIWFQTIWLQLRLQTTNTTIANPNDISFASTHFYFQPLSVPMVSKLKPVKSNNTSSFLVPGNHRKPVFFGVYWYTTCGHVNGCRLLLLFCRIIKSGHLTAIDCPKITFSAIWQCPIFHSRYYLQVGSSWGTRNQSFLRMVGFQLLRVEDSVDSEPCIDCFRLQSLVLSGSYSRG